MRGYELVKGPTTVGDPRPTGVVGAGKAEFVLDVEAWTGKVYLDGPEALVEGLAFRPDGRVLAVAHRDEGSE